MFFRTLGKLFFAFYVVPKIVDESRFVRKHAQPALSQITQDLMQKVSKNFAEKAEEARSSKTE